MLDLRHERSWEKWRRELRRSDPPPFLGPLVSINEAAEALGRCVGYVRKRIEDGRLNVWKDPVSKRVWILKDDVDILAGDNRALEEAGVYRGGKRGPRKARDSKAGPEDAECEDLDAIGGWEHPKPPEVIGGAAIEQSALESQARFAQRQRENEEWHAAELAKLEGGDPEEAVRQLRIERGWVTPEAGPKPDAEPESDAEPAADSTLMDLLPRMRSPRNQRKQRKQAPRPVSWSDPNPRPRTPPERYIDPDEAAILEPQVEVCRPFPIGWVGWKEGAAALQVSPNQFLRLARRHGLQRRIAPGAGRPRYVYDSIEIAALAERRLAASPPPAPGKRLDWWGSRRVKMELNEFDGWLTVREAAQLLGVNTRSISFLCNTGKLPCHQKQPGVSGSRLYVPHHHVLRLKERLAESKGRAAYEKGLRRDASQAVYIDKEEFGIFDVPDRGWSKACERDHGEYYSTRQAANVLGVRPNSVRLLMRRGRLTGHRINKKRRSSRPWWFFKKADVDALLADSEYNRNHRRWLKGVRRKAGWEE
jgi:hypothetical protein